MTNILFLCIIMILFGFCCYFFVENTRLKDKVLELEEENKEILERRIIKNKSTDQVSIQTISNDLKPNIQSSKVLKNQVQMPISSISSKEKNNTFHKKSTSYPQPSMKSNQPTPPKENKESLKEKSPVIPNIPIKQEISQKITSVPKTSLEPKVSLNTNTRTSAPNRKNYQKNTISNHSNITSPVSISGSDHHYKQESFDMNKLTLDLNEFIKKSEKVVPKITEKPVHPDYLKEISEKMANELKPQTIELTDYEKEQEEHAIISYQELLSIKDRLQIQDDEEESINFIEDLKQFRNSLN